MIRRPPRSTLDRSSAASDVYKRQEHDDLFLLCFYSHDPPYEPDANGKLCTAHIVTLHKDILIDTAKGDRFAQGKASDYHRLARQTKRIFRVVPEGHARCV